MSLTSYRAAPPRVVDFRDERDVCPAVCGSGGDLLSRALRRSTIGAEVFHVRVRDGIGCFILAITASPSNRMEALGLGIWGERFCMSDRLSMCLRGYEFVFSGV